MGYLESKILIFVFLSQTIVEFHCYVQYFPWKWKCVMMFLSILSPIMPGLSLRLSYLSFTALYNSLYLACPWCNNKVANVPFLLFFMLGKTVSTSKSLSLNMTFTYVFSSSVFHSSNPDIIYNKNSDFSLAEQNITFQIVQVFVRHIFTEPNLYRNSSLREMWTEIFLRFYCSQ